MDRIQPAEKGASIGMILGAASYLMWGALPIYWKQLSEVPALEVLCYRFVWSFITMCPFILLIPSWRKTFFQEIALILRRRQTLFAILGAAVLISLNWLTYIYAIAHEMIMESSLGYFLNPLINVLLAIVFLKERLHRSGIVACLLAFCGVAVVTWDAGVMPWVSLVLAATFAFYGLIKKQVRASAYTSLTMETLFIFPFALVYLLCFAGRPVGAHSLPINLLLLGSGFVTATPLFLFGESARRISYIAVSFLQYIAPTVNFFIACFLYKEPLSHLKLVGFILIWISILVYSIGMGLAARAGRASIPRE